MKISAPWNPYRRNCKENQPFPTGKRLRKSEWYRWWWWWERRAEVLPVADVCLCVFIIPYWLLWQLCVAVRMLYPA